MELKKGGRQHMGMSSLKIIAVAFVFSSTAGLAAAQRSPTDKAPTEPTANDPSVGTPSPPAADLTNPVGLSPQAARREGTSPDVTKNGPAEAAKDRR